MAVAWQHPLANRPGVRLNVPETMSLTGSGRRRAPPESVGPILILQIAAGATRSPCPLRRDHLRDHGADQHSSQRSLAVAACDRTEVHRCRGHVRLIQASEVRLACLQPPPFGATEAAKQPSQHGGAGLPGEVWGTLALCSHHITASKLNAASLQTGDRRGRGSGASWAVGEQSLEGRPSNITVVTGPKEKAPRRQRHACQGVRTPRNPKNAQQRFRAARKRVRSVAFMPAARSRRMAALGHTAAPAPYAAADMHAVVHTRTRAVHDKANRPHRVKRS